MSWATYVNVNAANTLGDEGSLGDKEPARGESYEAVNGRLTREWGKAAMVQVPGGRG